jgi:alkylhydroperoxidase family enzyme
LGKVGKGVKCSVSGCGEEAVRSLPAGEASRAGLRVATTTGRSYLCKNHYKEMKKKTKKDRQVERWRMKP